jgi:hypothetical protein
MEEFAQHRESAQARHHRLLSEAAFWAMLTQNRFSPILVTAPVFMLAFLVAYAAYTLFGWSPFVTPPSP